MKQYFSGASRNLEALTNNPIFIQPISQIYFSTSKGTSRVTRSFQGKSWWRWWGRKWWPRWRWNVFWWRSRKRRQSEWTRIVARRKRRKYVYKGILCWPRGRRAKKELGRTTCCFVGKKRRISYIIISGIYLFTSSWNVAIT